MHKLSSILATVLLCVVYATAQEVGRVTLQVPLLLNGKPAMSKDGGEIARVVEIKPGQVVEEIVVPPTVKGTVAKVRNMREIQEKVVQTVGGRPNISNAPQFAHGVVPHFPVPSVGVPQTGVPNVGVPHVGVSPVGVPQVHPVGVPQVHPVGVPQVPHVGVPHVGVPHVGVPHVGVPHVGVSPVGVPQVHPVGVPQVPHVGVPHVGVPHVGVPNVGAPHVGVTPVVVPQVPHVGVPPVVPGAVGVPIVPVASAKSMPTKKCHQLLLGNKSITPPSMMSDPATCETVCTKLEFLPICAYNGNCVHEFGNQCLLENFNCKHRELAFRQVDDDVCRLNLCARRCTEEDLKL